LIKRVLSWTALAGLAAVLALAGFWLLFSTFLIYDDEGYVLLSLKNFSLHGGLYDLVYTQYGPFIYLLYDALHRVLDFDFTNTAGRWITLVNWLGTAVVCAILVARQTRSALWTAFTLAGVFTYLWVMINEPVHPGGLLALLVALGAWLGSEAWAAGRLRAFVAITAATGVALAFTKINVGVFFLAATYTWLALNSTPGRLARPLVWLAAVACAALPFGLMNTLKDARWVQLFAVVFTTGTLAVILMAPAVARPVVTLRTWAWFAGSGMAASVLLLVLTLARGTSPHGLLDGMILEPMKHPGVFFFAMNWRIGTWVLALVSLALAGWASWARQLDRPAFRHLVAATRLTAAAVFLCSPLQLIPTGMAAWGLCYGVTLAWVFAVPLGDEPRNGPTRTWVALLLGFQCLHAYPVAGTQINWGTFLWVPLLVLGLHDALPVWRGWLGRFAGWMGLAGALVIVGVTLVMPWQLARIGRAHYSSDQPLALPGAANIRPSNDILYAVRIMDENARAHADMLFTFPGLYSFNLWTGLPTPTLANATHWFSLLSPVQQQDIIDRLSSTPRAALIVERDVLDYLAKTGFHPAGPLYDWLMQNYAKAFDLDGYELWVRHGRHIAAFSTARLATAAGYQELVVTLAATAKPVVRIELCDYDAPTLPLFTFANDDTMLRFQPVGLDDEATAESQNVRLPVAFTGPARLTLRYPPAVMHVARGHGLIVMRDASGSVVAEARVLD